MVDFYPSTILSAANFALIGLGAIEELDHEFKESIDYQDVVLKAIAMYEKAQSRRGGLPYGARTYQKGIQSGRTATCLIGLAALGLSDGDLFCKAAYFSVTNVETVPFGHASPAMHVCCGGLAFAMLGGEQWASFKKHHFDRLAQQQQASGAFNDFASGPDSLIGDSEVSTAYITALYTICFCADKSKFIQRLGKKFKTDDVLAKGKALVDSACGQSHALAKAPTKIDNAITLSPGERLILDGNFREQDVVAISSRDGTFIRWVNVDSGKELNRLPLKQSFSQTYEMQLNGDDLVLISMSYGNNGENAARDLQSQLRSGKPIEKLDPSETQNNPVSVRSYDIITGKVNWEQRLPIFSRVHLRKRSADFLSFNGSQLRRINLQTGQAEGLFLTIGGLINFGLFGIDGESCYVSALGVLVKHDNAGNKVWSARLKGDRAMVKPNPATIVAHAGQVYLSTAYGDIICYNAKTGKLNWKVETRGIVRLKLGSDGKLFALGDDGVLHRISTQAEISPTEDRFTWSTNIGSGQEKIVDGEANSSSFQFFVVGNRLVVRDKVTGKVSFLDSETGNLLFKTIGDEVQASDTVVSVQKGERIESWRID